MDFARRYQCCEFQELSTHQAVITPWPQVTCNGAGLTLPPAAGAARRGIRHPRAVLAQGPSIRLVVKVAAPEVQLPRQNFLGEQLHALGVGVGGEGALLVGGRYALVARLARRLVCMSNSLVLVMLCVPRYRVLGMQGHRTTLSGK